jgi:hypothetical protein
VSADKVIFQVSDALLITGAFSLRVGPVRLVDVNTGLNVPNGTMRRRSASSPC